MEQFKQILKRIFFLPPLPTVLLALFGYAFVLLVAAFHVEIPVIQYLSYISSAYALIITITGFPHFTSFTRAVKQYINEHPLTKKLRSTAIGERFFNDVRFRSDISLYQGLFINLLYIAMKMYSGIYYRSVWFITLAVYYILLAVMRFMLLRHGKKKAGRTIMSATKAINLVAAMVSILSLETAMVARFSSDADEFRRIMTSATGGGVCIIVLGMAVFMIWKSTKQIKKLYLIER